MPVLPSLDTPTLYFAQTQFIFYPKAFGRGRGIDLGWGLAGMAWQTDMSAWLGSKLNQIIPSAPVEFGSQQGEKGPETWGFQAFPTESGAKFAAPFGSGKDRPSASEPVLE